MNLNDRKNTANQKGFTIIEVMISILILTIGLLAIGTMQIAAIRGNAKSNNLTLRTTSASNYIEYLLKLPFNHPDLTAGEHKSDSDGVDNDRDGKTDQSDDDGEINYTVSWVVTDESEDLKSITLTFSGSYYNEAKTMTFNTKKIR